jgi:hypothetical protein
MAEAAENKLGVFKIWRNPAMKGEPVTYMGDFYPPDGRVFFTPNDLQELGFGPGTYTVLCPERRRFARSFTKWQTVVVPR